MLLSYVRQTNWWGWRTGMSRQGWTQWSSIKPGSRSGSRRSLKQCRGSGGARKRRTSARRTSRPRRGSAWSSFGRARCVRRGSSGSRSAFERWRPAVHGRRPSSAACRPWRTAGRASWTCRRRRLSPPPRWRRAAVRRGLVSPGRRRSPPWAIRAGSVWPRAMPHCWRCRSWSPCCGLSSKPSGRSATPCRIRWTSARSSPSRTSSSVCRSRRRWSSRCLAPLRRVPPAWRNTSSGSASRGQSSKFMTRRYPASRPRGGRGATPPPSATPSAAAAAAPRRPPLPASLSPRSTPLGGPVRRRVPQGTMPVTDE
mmetsp:Transcript_107319/g.320959  ORF Transcript_107319/g.320959 Transcript_107319/m.320959 type:complete len:312 (-) Transcript_107319:27-962(-)